MDCVPYPPITSGSLLSGESAYPSPSASSPHLKFFLSLLHSQINKERNKWSFKKKGSIYIIHSDYEDNCLHYIFCVVWNFYNSIHFNNHKIILQTCSNTKKHSSKIATWEERNQRKKNQRSTGLLTWGVSANNLNMFQISYSYAEWEPMLDNQDLHILWKWRTSKRKGFFFAHIW